MNSLFFEITLVFFLYHNISICHALLLGPDFSSLSLYISLLHMQHTDYINVLDYIQVINVIYFWTITLLLLPELSQRVVSHLITDPLFSGLNNHSFLKYYFHTYLSFLVLTWHFAKSTCHVFPHQIQMSSWSGLCNLIPSFFAVFTYKHHHKLTLFIIHFKHWNTISTFKFPIKLHLFHVL